MLPYFTQPSWQIGSLTIHAFGIAVAASVWVGLTLVSRRFEQAELNAEVGQRLVGWMLIGGLIGAHLFSVLLYFPASIRADPWILFRVWEDLSSFGGMLGGVVAAGLFFRIRAGPVEARRMLSYFDAIAFVFPGALAIGRVGCALAHDHPGAVTTFPLAISLESDAAQRYFAGIVGGANLPPTLGAPRVGFHDLGLYEFLFLAAVVTPAFAYWNRRGRPTGFYLVAFSALYFPVRFGFDFLRVADARYLNLTPAQWVAAIVVVGLPLVVLRGRRRSTVVGGAMIVVAACACWHGT